MADIEEDSLLESLKQAASGKVKEETEKPAEEEIEETTGASDDETEETDTDDTESPRKKEVEQAEDEDGVEDDKPTRGQSRHQRLANQLKEEREERQKDKEEREKLIAEKAGYAARLEEYERRQQAGQSEAHKRAEEERLSLLTDSERATYHTQRKNQELEYRLNHMEQQRQDDLDRSEFRAKAATDPLVEKYKDEVERLRKEDLKRGLSAPRDAYLNFIVGEAIRKNAASKISSKKKSADKRIDSVTSKPVGARGDVKGSKSGKTVEERLAGVLI